MIYYRKANMETPPDFLIKAMGELGVDFDLWCEDQKKSGKPHWAFDSWRINGTICPDASKLFYTQPSWGKAFTELVGINNAKCVTYAVDEEIYPEINREQEYDLGFIGNMLEGDGRRELFEKLKSKYTCFISHSIDPRGIAVEYAKCKLIINPQRFEEINIRFFEALASGVQIVSYSPALHLFAEDGKDYVSYRSVEELYGIIDTLLEDSNRRKEIKKRARESVLTRHTYKHRVREMMSIL